MEAAANREISAAGSRVDSEYTSLATLNRLINADVRRRKRGRWCSSGGPGRYLRPWALLEPATILSQSSRGRGLVAGDAFAASDALEAVDAFEAEDALFLGTSRVGDATPRSAGCTSAGVSD
jgi:hypothetical protein